MRNQFVNIIILILFILSSCKSIQKRQDMESIVFLYHYGVVENFVKLGYTSRGEVLWSSIEFLEKLTKIKCDFEHQHDIFYTPTKKNLKDWKKWFKKNKEKIYLDDDEKILKIKSNVHN